MSTWDRWSGLDQIYADLTPAAIRLAYLITADLGTAEDVVQDAFLRLAEKHREVFRSATAQAYLNKAVVREVASHRRRLTARIARHADTARDQTPPANQCICTKCRQGCLFNLAQVECSVR